MRLRKTFPRLAATVLGVVVFGLSPIAIGAKHKLFSDSYTDSDATEAPIPVRYLTRSAPAPAFAPTGPVQAGGDGAVDSHPRPGTSDSGLPLILVGFGLVGGAVFMRRITPG